MAIVTLDNVTIRFRGPALLDDANCVIEARQRIGLLGRNGAGKTTLLRLIAGQVEPDHGQVQVEPGVQISFLPQEVPQDLSGDVRSVVLSGLEQAELPEWEADLRIDKLLTQMQLDAASQVESMSAGMKRRVLLAKALVSEPDLLLLDEPTNHLDVDSICWLEDFLSRYSRAFMFITHDRQFLRKLADRILEIENGEIFDWSCDYDTFLKRKEAALEALEKQQQLFDKKLAEEEAWIRQGIKARRTRNEGRVRALKQLREIRRDRREKVGTSDLKIQEGERSGNLVVRVKDVSFQYSAHEEAAKLLDGFSTTILRGDKVGIVGPNGVGKTTLLKILLGDLVPQHGDVRLGTNLQVVYFDQLREQLDDQQTVEQAVADGYQTVKINGADRHVLGYLQDFLFTPERARTRIAHLSGGERNRVLLAKLFTKPANVIVLDEPTNDLDAETMEMLEERLVDYSGTLLVVSHDREFLNQVVTSLLAFEPRDEHNAPYELREYVGGYDDWKRQVSQRAAESGKSTKKQSQREKQTVGSGTAEASTAEKRRLSFKEQKELESLPEQIEDLEASVSELHQQMADPMFYKRAGDEIAATQEQLANLQAKLETQYERWQELEEIVGN